MWRFVPTCYGRRKAVRRAPPKKTGMRQRSCSSSIERAQTARSVCVHSEPQRVEAFNGLPRGWAGEFLLQLSSVDQADLLLALPEREPRIWLRLLLPDDTADLFQHAPEEERDRMKRSAIFAIKQAMLKMSITLMFSMKPSACSAL